MLSPNEYITAISVYADAGLIGTFGGSVNYFYYIQKHDIAFKIANFITAIFIAFFVGVVAYFFLPDSQDRAGYLMLLGFLSYKIIDFAEANSAKIIKKIIKKWL